MKPLVEFGLLVHAETRPNMQWPSTKVSFVKPIALTNGIHLEPLSTRPEIHRTLETGEGGSFREGLRMEFVMSMSAFRLERVAKTQFGI